MRAELNVASGDEDGNDDVVDDDVIDDVDDGSRLLLPPPPPSPLRREGREMSPKSTISQYPFVLRCLYTPLYTWPQS